MAITHLALIDYAIIACYMIGTLAIGAYFSKYVHSTGDLFLAGRALPFWALGMSIVVTDIGATDMIAGSGAAYTYGIAQANFDWIGSMPAMLIAGFVFVPYYWRSGVFTIPEFLARRYNRFVGLIETIIWLFFMASMLAVMLWTSAVFLNSQLEMNHKTAIWLTAIIVGIYTVTGGLAAVVMTDVIQMVIMFVGTAALLALCVWDAGGWSDMTQSVLAIGAETKDHFHLLLPHDTATPYPWTGIVFGLGIVMSTGYFVGNQAVVQRVLGARSEWDAKAGMIFAGFLKLFIPVLVMVPGLAARATHQHLGNPDTAVPILIRELFPPGLMGLMFAAFFAALMSSVDSYLNSTSTMFMSDLYGKMYASFKGGDVPERHGLMVGRSVTAILIVSAAFTAPLVGKYSTTIYEAIQTLLSMFQGPTLAILLLGILWRRANGFGAVAGLLVGLAATTTLTLVGDQVFPASNPFLFVSFWSFLIALAVTVIVSLCTPRQPEDKIRGFVYGAVMSDPSVQTALNQRVNGHD